MFNHHCGYISQEHARERGKQTKEPFFMYCKVAEDFTVKVVYYLLIGIWKLNLPVNPSWPEEGLVKNINSICSH